MRRSIAALAGSLLLLSGCTGSAEVSTDELEEQVTTRLTEEVGQAPDDVTCPDPLPAEEGENVTCVLTAGEVELDVDVTVSAVEDDTVNFDIEVAQEPN